MTIKQSIAIALVTAGLTLSGAAFAQTSEYVQVPDLSGKSQQLKPSADLMHLAQKMGERHAQFLSCRPVIEDRLIAAHKESVILVLASHGPSYRLALEAQFEEAAAGPADRSFGSGSCSDLKASLQNQVTCNIDAARSIIRARSGY